MIALYVRVSEAQRGRVADVDGAGDGRGECRGHLQASVSVASQEMMLREHVRQMEERGDLRGWECDAVQVFSDDGWSGMNMRRPALTRMLDACSAGEVDCVMVNDLSRLSRSYIDLGDLLEGAFPKAGVRFVSRMEGIDISGAARWEREFGPGADDDLLRAVVALCNNAYSLQISANVKASMAASWHRGEHVQANVPFGYVYDLNARGRLRPDPVASRWVRLAFELAAKGLSPREVADELNARGIPTPSSYARERGSADLVCYRGASSGWNVRKVRYLLRREVYAGVLVGGATRSLGVGRGSAKRATAAWEQVRVADAHEPLVSRDAWEAAQGSFGR